MTARLLTTRERRKEDNLAYTLRMDTLYVRFRVVLGLHCVSRLHLGAIPDGGH